MSWASTYLNDEDAGRQSYALERAGQVYAGHEQRAADAKAAEDNPSYVADALYGIAHGATSAVDETLEFGSDVLELAGMEDTGDVTWMRRHFGTLDEPSTWLGQGVAGVTQFLAAYVAPGGLALKGAKMAARAAKGGRTGGSSGVGAQTAQRGAQGAATGTAGTVAKVGEAVGRGAVADAVGFDPHEARLSTMLNEVPALRPVVSDWMASNEPDDPAWEGRLKNAIEGAALGVPAELLFLGLRRAVGAARAGRAERAQISPEGQALRDVAERDAVEAQGAAQALAQAARTDVAGLPDGDAYLDRLIETGEGFLDEDEVVEMWERYTAAVVADPAAARRMAKEAGFSPDETPAPPPPSSPPAPPSIEGGRGREGGGADGTPSQAGLEGLLERAMAREREGRARTDPAALRREPPQGDTLDLEALERTVRKEAAWRGNSTGQVVQRFVDGDDLMADTARTPFGMRRELVRVHGAANDAGVLTPELRHAATTVNKRLEEWEMAPMSAPREAATRAAVQSYKSLLGKAAADLDAEATPPVAKDSEARWSTEADTEWGSVPLMDTHAPGMARPRFAARRTVSISDARAGRPDDFGVMRSDETLLAFRPDEADTLAVEASYTGGMRRDADRPVDIYFEDARTLDDLDGLEAAVEAASDAAPTAAGSRVARETLRGVLSDRFGMSRWQTRGAGGDAPQAALDTLAAASDSLHRLSRMAAHGEASTEVQTQFVRALMKTQALAWRAGGDMARAREAMAGAEIPVMDAAGLSRKLWQHRRLGEEGGQHVAALAAAVRNADSMGEVLGIARQWRSVKMPLREGLAAAGSRFVARPAREIWINSVLSSPATHMRNLVGNLVMPVMQVPENFLAGVVSRGITRPQSYAESAREVQAMVAGFAGGWRDALWLARRDLSISMAARVGDTQAVSAGEAALRARGLDTMHHEFVSQIKVDDATRLSDEAATGLPQAMLEWSSGHAWGKAAHVLDRATRKAITAPTAMLQAEDVFMKTLTWRMELHRHAMNQALSEGRRGDALRARVAEVVADPDTHAPQIRAAAMTMAHRNTFTQALPGWGEATLDWLNAVPGARYVVPFFKTPSNIVLTAGEYTPGLNLLYRTHREALARGGREGAQVKAKMAMGTAVLTMGGLLTANGTLTGGDPTNPQFRATARKLGRREYAFRVGDTWVDYRFVGGPLGLVLGMSADVSMAAAAAATDDELDAVSALAQTSAFVAGSVIDETWLGSLSEFVDMVSGGQMTSAAAQRWVANTARGFTPLSAAGDDVRQIVDVLRGQGVRQDLQVREGYAGADEPGWEWLSETMRGASREMLRPFDWWGDKGMPVRDLYGEPVTYYRPEEGPINVGEATGAALSPLAFHQQRTDPLSVALLRYMPALPRIDRNHVVQGPSWAGNSRALELDADSYDWIQQRAGRLFKQEGTRLVGLKGFEALPSDTARQGQLAQAWSSAKLRAKREAEQRFPELRRRIAAEKLRLRNEARGG